MLRAFAVDAVHMGPLTRTFVRREPEPG